MKSKLTLNIWNTNGNIQLPKTIFCCHSNVSGIIDFMKHDLDAVLVYFNKTVDDFLACTSNFIKDFGLPVTLKQEFTRNFDSVIIMVDCF